MKNIIFALCALSAAFASAAVANVSSIALQQGANKRVTVSYTLDAPAIVTVDFLTNGVSIGEQNFTDVFGDVNQLVSKVGETCTISWKPYRSWPDRTIADSAFTAKVTAWATNAPPDYLVVDLDVWGNSDYKANSVKYYVSTNALPNGGLANDIYRTTKLVMRRMHAAGVSQRFGSPYREPGRTAAWETARLHTLSEDYYLAIYEFTQKQFQAAVGYKYSCFFRETDWEMRPMECISYKTLRGETTVASSWPKGEDPHAVGEWSPLDAIRRRTGLKVDLPTFAQWEFACRAGSETGLDLNLDITDTAVGAVCPNLGAIARYAGNVTVSSPTASTPAADGGTAKVGSYRPNPWGFYDMHGNVAEVCLDFVDANNDFWGKKGNVFAVGYPEIDPTGPDTSASGHHLQVGGSYSEWPYGCRTTSIYAMWYGSGDVKNCGFRLCCPIGLK